MDKRRIASRTRAIAGLITTGFFLAAGEGFAQQVVPRAQPVDDTPPRAIPVDPNTGQPLPSVKTPANGPDQDLFDYATLCYAQKDYALALKPFSDYARNYPKGRHVADAWFHMGECYLRLGQKMEAAQAFNTVIKSYPGSESTGSAAYRLGALAYNERDFERAAQLFDLCQKSVQIPDIKSAAMNNKALAYKMAGQKGKALAAYQAVAALTKDNPYRENALLEVAAAASDAGRKDEALAALVDLISFAKDDAVLGDALIRVGLLQSDLGKTGEALKNFKRALALKDLPADKRGIGVFGQIQAAYASGDFKTVVETYSANSTLLPPQDLRAKQLLIIGLAYKQQQRYRQAVEIFLMVERNYADEPEAFESGYHKLLCFFQMNDSELVPFAQNFEERYRVKYKGHEYLMMSRLIRADWHFGKADYQKAAEAYAETDVKMVPEKVRASVLYKKGFAEAEAGIVTDAIGTLTAFITEYPKDDNLPLALAQRGIAYKTARDFPKAIADFAAIIKAYPAHAAAEMALYQSGLIKSETRDSAGMIADFETLVAKFPKSAAAPEALYRIGKGYFDQQTKDGFKKALPPLHQAIAVDAAHFLDRASQIIISCEYLMENLDGLAKEVDAYLDAKKDANISPKILTYLGAKYFERGNFPSAAIYLTRASTPDHPEATEALVWNYLGMAEYENGRHAIAVSALDNYLSQTPTGAGRAKALLSKGKALLVLNKFDEAEKCATEGLNMVREGGLHARLQILQGDIANAHGDLLAQGNDKENATKEWQKASASYVLISQIIVDAEITPEALSKGIEILEKLGDAAKADALRKQLTGKYPNYKAKK